MRLLTAIFSYNRFPLLRNTVESYCEYGPEGDLLIVDDGSDDPRIVAYLDSLKDRATVKRRDRNEHNVHGGLYHNMSLATDFAIEKGYSHIFFVQDDVQFMWRDPDFAKRIEAVFAACTDAAMVSPVFFKGIAARQFRKRSIPHPSGLAWHVEPYSIVDMGIMPLKLIEEKQWRFGANETDNSRVWREWGYKLYLIPTSTVALIPWPQVRVSGQSFGAERSPVKKYFLKPMNEKQITRLCDRAKGLARLPFHEDYCLPWGWWCWSPYWFTKVNRDFWKYLYKSMRHNERWPRPVRAN